MVAATFRRKLAEGTSSRRITRLRPRRASARRAQIARINQRGLRSCGFSFRYPVFGIRFCFSFFLFAFLAFSASATPTNSREHAEASGAAQVVTIASDDRGAHSPAAASSLINEIDCITSGNQEKQPSPDDNNFPDSTTDLDDTDGGLDDLSARADTSTRNDQDTPLFSVTGLDAMTLRTPRILSNLLFSVHCFYCLHEHIRERAPPILG
jgi:hypothetical protein